MQSRAATQSATAARAVRPARRYAVNRLRVLATSIFFSRSARFFDPTDWRPKNAERSTFLTLFVVLWFLQVLFIVSLVAQPLLLYLRSQSGQRLVGAVAGWCHRREGIFLFLVGLILVRIGLRSFFAGEHTWADLVEYALSFLKGYLIPASQRLAESYRRDGWLARVGSQTRRRCGWSLYVLELGL